MNQGFKLEAEAGIEPAYTALQAVQRLYYQRLTSEIPEKIPFQIDEPSADTL